jgi:hypothetical protein
MERRWRTTVPDPDRPISVPIQDDLAVCISTAALRPGFPVNPAQQFFSCPELPEVPKLRCSTCIRSSEYWLRMRRLPIPVSRGSLEHRHRPIRGRIHAPRFPPKRTTQQRESEVLQIARTQLTINEISSRTCPCSFCNVRNDNIGSWIEWHLLETDPYFSSSLRRQGSSSF